jgi:hypothetical protein
MRLTPYQLATLLNVLAAVVIFTMAMLKEE